MDFKSLVGIQSQLEMSSVDKSSMNEFDDESLFSPETDVQKTQSTQPTDQRSFPGRLQANGDKMLITLVYKSIKTVVFSNKLNLLMPFGPLAILVHKLTGSRGWVFFLTLLGITPLAERLGYATEQLAFYTGATVGGLLNATFGNATELIISIYALKHGMIRVVQQSLLGSILSNMLLVLGCAFFSGGLVYHKEQVFNKATAVVNSGLLLMAVMGLLFPAVLHYTHSEVHFGKSELALSRFSSCVMLLAYGAYLYFQLKGQNNMYEPIVEEGNQNGEITDDDESPEISKWESIIWLSIMTAWISILSEYLVNTIEGASVAWKIPVAFISVILLPIVGNAAEHASAVMFAMKDKLVSRKLYSSLFIKLLYHELQRSKSFSAGHFLGSGNRVVNTDIYVRGRFSSAWFLSIPFSVVIGWIMGREMDLNFQLFETATLFITVLVVAFLLQEGTSNYFKGLMLILCYLIVAASFFVHVDPSTVDDDSQLKT